MLDIIDHRKDFTRGFQCRNRARNGRADQFASQLR
jgi:hypothetical protein